MVALESQKAMIHPLQYIPTSTNYKHTVYVENPASTLATYNHVLYLNLAMFMRND